MDTISGKLALALLSIVLLSTLFTTFVVYKLELDSVQTPRVVATGSPGARLGINLPAGQEEIVQSTPVSGYVAINIVR